MEICIVIVSLFTKQFHGELLSEHVEEKKPFIVKIPPVDFLSPAEHECFSTDLTPGVLGSPMSGRESGCTL